MTTGKRRMHKPYTVSYGGSVSVVIPANSKRVGLWVTPGQNQGISIGFGEDPVNEGGFHFRALSATTYLSKETVGDNITAEVRGIAGGVQTSGLVEVYEE